MDIKEVEKGIKAIKEFGLKKVEGENFIIYRVQNIIRIDIKEE